jgi:potassium-transporting ATPase KdpC subunit
MNDTTRDPQDSSGPDSSAEGSLRGLLRPALLLLALFTALTGVIYPLAITSAAQVFFPDEANGSLVRRHGAVVGSALIGQPFEDPKHFWGRPSATGPQPYNAAASTGSNLGPNNPALAEAIAARVAALRAADPANAAGAVPVDLVTASGSGLDPHLTPASAFYQVPRVARLRGLPEARVRALVEAHVEDRAFGSIGEPRVNVLQLNLALDELR